MDRKFNLRNLEADKIVLLGLFVLSLLIAHLIVSVKTAIVLSEPIELAHTGLSVSIPVGKGWRSEKLWQYHQNVYTLSSNFIIGGDRPTALGYCLYTLTAETAAPQKWFEQKAAEIDGKIIETNQERINALTIDWAHIEKPELLRDTFLGMIELPNNRRLSIEVTHQITSEFDLAEKIFRQIISSINFEDNQLLKAGIELVSEIKGKGIDSFLDYQSRQANFFIKEPGQQTIGFMIDILIDSDQDAPFNIRAAGHIYGENLREQATLFRCKNNFAEFVWQSETNSITGRNDTEITLDEAGILTILDSEAQTISRYHLSPAAIPDVFAEQLFRQMIESNVKKSIVEIIDADGKITPTLASVIEDEENVTASEDAAYVIKLEFLDGQGFYQIVYLNDKRQITKVIIQQNKRYILESTSIEDIAREFPDRADFISQRNGIFR